MPPPRGRRRHGPPDAGWRSAAPASVATLCALALATTGCTYSKSEPGLFRPAADTSTAPPVERRPPEPTDPELPVVAESVWTSGEGLEVTTRFAIHAVRRMPGATVLDWSVTPLAAPGFGTGDPLPTWVDLGLTQQSQGDVNLLLLDPAASQVYRPLAHRSRREFRRCLCSPLWVAQLSLRVGETRLLQVSYPELPEALRFVDVSFPTLAPFRHVPVTPSGQVPTAVQPTDLARPFPEPRPVSPPQQFRYPGQRPARVQSIEIMSVTAGPGLTSMEWRLRSVTDQPVFNLLPNDPPVSAVLPSDVLIANPSSASGPQLRVGGTPLPLRWVRSRASVGEVFECLCTSLGLWASGLRQQGGSVQVATNFGALPAGARSVDVVLPTVGTVPDVPVAPAADAAARSGPPRMYAGGQWTYQSSSPPQGWSTQDWPTPLPAASQVPDFVATVDRLTDLPGE